MTIDDAVESLERFCLSLRDEVLRYNMSQLLAGVDVMLKARKRGWYQETRELVEFVKEHSAALLATPSLQGEPRIALEEVSLLAGRVMRQLSRVSLDVRPPGPYSARYPVGSTVRLRSRDELEAFMNSWKLHHALVAEQLRFADIETVVQSVAYYHGGDVIYTLRDAGAFGWLEPCLMGA